MKQKVYLFIVMILTCFELESLSVINFKMRKHLVLLIVEHKSALTALDFMKNLLIHVQRR